MTDNPGNPGWQLVEVRVPPDSGDAAADVLWSLGAGAVEELRGPDGATVLRANVDEVMAARVSECITALGGTWSWIVVPFAVTESWRQHATPSWVIDDVWLVPAWVEPPPGRTVLVEPFDTFGLGNHPSTVLALRAALRVATGGSRVMDMGSGSGVIAVALAALCGSRCDAHDVAVQAERALLHNARLNGVEDRVRWLAAPGTAGDRGYGLVVANILAPVLRELAPTLVGLVEPGGHLVLSGLRHDQVDGVVDLYDGCSRVTTDESDGWVAVSLCR